MNPDKILKVILAVVVVGIIIIAINNNNAGFSDNGIDVSNTACENIETARATVDKEAYNRKIKAADDLAVTNKKISDNFWEENKRLEQVHTDCILKGLIADPCKESLERASRLAQEILIGGEVGNGFDEAKFQEREEAKAEYDKCAEDPDNQEDGYNTLKIQCGLTLKVDQEKNQTVRQAAEEASQNTYDVSIVKAENARQEKHNILNAIEEKCNKSAEGVSAGVGSSGVDGIDGTQISKGSACGENFSGNNSNLEKNLRDLENQLQKARVAGLRDGLYGFNHLQRTVDEARQALKKSKKTCEVDADCGDTTPVCCSNNSIGRVFCYAGICTNEIINCEDLEVCAGDPAQCIDPSTGVLYKQGNS